MTSLTPDTIDRIERELLIETPLAPADLLFVFGTRHGVPEFLALIEELWRRQLFRVALVTGGPTLGMARSEAAVLAEGMMAFGFPGECLILEEAAANTGENVRFSLPRIEARLGLARVGSLIAVGKFYTSARYLMTLQRHWPEVEKMIAGVCFPPYRRDEWHADPATREKVLTEWRKLAPYLDSGFIAPWPN